MSIAASASLLSAHRPSDSSTVRTQQESSPQSLPVQRLILSQIRADSSTLLRRCEVSFVANGKLVEWSTKCYTKTIGARVSCIQIECCMIIKTRENRTKQNSKVTFTGQARRRMPQFCRALRREPRETERTTCARGQHLVQQTARFTRRE